MRILVRSLRGERVALDVDATTTVAQVKSLIAARERVPVETQRLFFAGRLLDDDDAPVARYGVQNGSVVFLSLRLRDDTQQHGRQEMRNVQMPQPEPVTVKQEESQQHPVRVHDGGGGGGEGIVKRKLVSRRSLRKILSGLHVDVWTTQHDAKFLDLLLRHSSDRGVGNLTAGDWSSVRAELNAATGSAFPVEELQRRFGEFRRVFNAVGRIKSHPSFSYDARRRVVVATEADWKRYVLENPEAAAYEGRNPHLGRLRAIFAGNSGSGGDGGAKCRESWAKTCLSKLLRSFRLR